MATVEGGGMMPLSLLKKRMTATKSGSAGTLVWSLIKSHPPWPGLQVPPTEEAEWRVQWPELKLGTTGYRDPERALVKFFGAPYQLAWVPRKDIHPWDTQRIHDEVNDKWIDSQVHVGQYKGEGRRKITMTDSLDEARDYLKSGVINPTMEAALSMDNFLPKKLKRKRDADEGDDESPKKKAKKTPEKAASKKSKKAKEGEAATPKKKSTKKDTEATPKKKSTKDGESAKSKKMSKKATEKTPKKASEKTPKKPKTPKKTPEKTTALGKALAKAKREAEEKKSAKAAKPASKKVANGSKAAKKAAKPAVVVAVSTPSKKSGKAVATPVKSPAKKTPSKRPVSPATPSALQPRVPTPRMTNNSFSASFEAPVTPPTATFVVPTAALAEVAESPREEDATPMETCVAVADAATTVVPSSSPLLAPETPTESEPTPMAVTTTTTTRDTSTATVSTPPVVVARALEEERASPATTAQATPLGEDDKTTPSKKARILAASEVTPKKAPKPTVVVNKENAGPNVGPTTPVKPAASPANPASAKKEATAVTAASSPGLGEIPVVMPHQVERITDMRVTKKGVEYKLKWRGFSEHSKRWVPSSCLVNCPGLMREFMNERRRMGLESCALLV